MAASTSSKVTDKTLRVERAKEYPQQVWYLIACFIATVALFQLVSWAVTKLAKKAASPGDTESGARVPRRGFSIRHIPRAIINFYRVIAFRWTLQIGSSYTLNLAEVFIICAYTAALFVWEFINTTDLEGHKFDLSYWGNRAGTIASIQFPLITALGTKNNVISYLTGVSYDKLNSIHRMMARAVFVLLWVHGGNKFATSVWSDYPSYFIPIGITAMVAFSLLIIVSLRPIRTNAYELFFVTHFLMALLVLVGGYIHANEQYMGAYIWPSLLIWGLDRFIRVVRLLVFNHPYSWFTSEKHDLDATVELLSPHFVRLRLARPSHFHWKPGQTAYIMMPSVSKLPTEAHPFTIASIEDSGSELVDEKLGETAPYWKELVFMIQVREGFTKRLADAARKGEKVKVLVDGPYGFTPDLTNDDTVVLVAGGSGVTFTLSSFLGVVNDVHAGKSSCRKIVWIWTIRDSSHIDWISKALSKALERAPPSLTINILVYVTSGEPLPVRPQQSFDDDSVHNSETSTKEGDKSSAMVSLLEFSAVQVFSGRPDLHTLLRDEVDATSGRMSVTVCGSQAIARACRAALRFPVSGPSNILKGGPDVVLHVESFGYA